MIRKISFLLAALMIVFSFAACSSGSNDEKKSSSVESEESSPKTSAPNASGKESSEKVTSASSGSLPASSGSSAVSSGVVSSKGSTSAAASSAASSPVSSPAASSTPAESSPSPAQSSQTASSVVELTTKEVLAGKQALFVGDSICMASTHDKDHQWWGYAGRVATYNDMKYFRNAGVDGASVSNCRGTNTVINQIKNNVSTKYDFVVLEGGTNDAWDVVDIGTMTAGTAEEANPADFDQKTFAGGLEYLLWYTKKYYPKATLVYVITPKMNSSIGSLNDMSAYVDATHEICEKWGVPCLDFYNMGTEFYLKPIARYYNKYLADGIHPNSAGYELMAPFIADFMAKCYFEKHS